MTTATTPQQQQQQIRIALSEIPSRLEAIRFISDGTTTPTAALNRQSPNEPTPATILNTPHLLDNTTNVALSQDRIRAPMPSPDELIIRQRGRRRFNNSHSPDAVSTPLRIPFQRTPTKVPLSSSMILRSSPRKRLTIGSTPPAPEPPVMPSPIKAKQQLWPPSIPLAKRQRFGNEDGDEGRPMAQMSGETPLQVLLQGLSQQQLIELIVADLVAGDRQVEDRLRTQLPMPDIDPLEEELLHAKRLIFRSLPTSRLCKKTDSSAYSRAALHLNEFKRLLSSHTKQLYDSGHWDALVDYVAMAWPIVRGTPHWDSPTHNVVRRQCFKLLACHCITALKNGGPRLGTLRLHALERNMCEWTRDYEDVQSCLSVLTKTITKGRITL